MIHVQIASQVTMQGPSGVRWVLLEPATAAPADTAQLAPPADAEAAPAPQPPAVGTTSDGLRLTALKGVVVALGLGAALWTASVQVGPPGRTPLPAAQGHGSPAGTAVVPLRAAPLPLRIAPAAPLAADPAASAASRPTDSLPRLTASLP